jgi:para-aminobenzoate synthetase/4-amino-4-deoxychorismate lyase
MRHSAEYFNFTWDEHKVRQKLEELQRKYLLGCWRVRLLASKDGQLETQTTALISEPERVWRISLAEQPVDSSNRFLFHKTTHRPFYEQSLQERPDCDDLIFFNERGEITESSIANVVIVKGREKVTPARTAGLLAGTFRDELLAAGVISERVITKEDLKSADEVFLIDSVRKWMRAALVEA